MARAKLPSLQEIIDNPDVIASLPAPMLEEVVTRLKEVQAQAFGGVNVPPDPIELAIRYPKWRWLDARHLHYLSERVARTIENVEAEIVCMPPRHCKSTTLSLWTPFWVLAKNPQSHILLISYEANYAREWGIGVRRLVELYGAEFGLFVDPKRSSGENWAVTAGGGMITAGVGAGIGGKPADVLICDDLIGNDESARSEIVRNHVYEWWTMTALQRIEQHTAVIMIGTRWHEDDIIGRLVRDARDGTGHPFKLISLPALAEADDPLGRDLDQGLWPERVKQEFYEDRRNKTPSYIWHCVYQQHPSPPGGNMVDPSWWRFYRPSELPSHFDQGCQSWDLSLDSSKKTDSYHCGGAMARLGAQIFMLDAFHKHSDINEVMGTIRAWNQIYPMARSKLIERAISGVALVQMLRQEVGGIMAWPPKGKRKGSKEACLIASVPDIQSGHVLLPINPDGSKPKWVDELIEELRQFPNAANDDYVDMLSQGVNFLSPAARKALSDAHGEALGVRPELSAAEEHTKTLHKVIDKLGQPRIREIKRALGESSSPRVLPFGKNASQAQAQGSNRRRMW